jgi:hypothetical protein
LHPIITAHGDLVTSICGAGSAMNLLLGTTASSQHRASFARSEWKKI